jgi:nucleoside-diphosphate kinase
MHARRCNNLSSLITKLTFITYFFLLQIKPDGVQRGLVGEIVSRFEKKGYKLAGMKTRMASKELLEEHYNELTEKSFFPKLRDYMLSGPVS